MPRYRFKTVDAHGRPISGELEAARIEEALQKLQADGLDPARNEIEKIADGPIEPGNGHRPLSTGEAAQLAGNLAELTEAQMPLGPGLRAMADEVRSRPLGNLFRRLARQADEGVPMETAMSNIGHQFPAHVRGLVLAGTRSSRLAEVLGEFAALQRERSDLTWRIGISMAYPLLLISALVGMFMFCGLLIVPPLVAVLEDFETEIPSMTMLLISMSTNGTRILVAILVILVPLLLLWLVMPRPHWVVRCLYQVPFLGSIWKWQGLVEFSRLMGLLLAQDVPMPEALRLTSDAVRSPDLQAACLKSATRIEAGGTFSDCIERYQAFPATLKPFVDFGNQSSRPAEGFEAAAEVYKRRIGVDATLWEIVIPPLMLVLIAGFVGFLVISMLLPMISLITTLT
jgi:type II secretory pathway component PulF